jgi:serine/threonine-protein kinase
MVKDRRSGAVKFVVRAVVARYAPSGHLLYVTADGTLMASRFDLDQLQLVGSPVVVARGVGVGGFGVADVALSPDGSLLYTTDNSSTIGEPTWVDRTGVATPVDTAWPNGLTSTVAISPDGSKIAFEFIGSASSSSVADIWVRPAAGGALSRLTFGPNNLRPSWTADGRDVVFLSEVGGRWALYRQRSDGSERARLVASMAQGIGEGFLSPDGTWVILRSPDTNCCDIFGVRPGVDSVPVPLVATEFRERGPALSPDGKWLAYSSDETGRFEVFVRPFPAVTTGKWQVSGAGGASPRWSRRGDELFYRDANADMQAARIATTPKFAVVGTQRLFNASGYFDSPWAQTYDVSPDGQHFLMLVVGGSTGAANTSPVLVQNFATDLRRQLP